MKAQFIATFVLSLTLQVRGKFVTSLNNHAPQKERNLTKTTWEDIADYVLCSSGQPDDIVNALNKFDPSADGWFVYVG